MYEDEIVLSSMIAIIFAAIGCLIAYALGYFVYGSVVGGLAIILLCVIYGVLMVVAMVPVIGFLIQAFVILNYVWPVLSEVTGIEASWLTTLVFAFYVLAGFGFTITTTKKAAGY